MITMIIVLNGLSDLIETDKVGSLFFLCVGVVVSLHLIPPTTFSTSPLTPLLKEKGVGGMRYHSFPLTFNASLKPFPNKLKASTSNMIAKPGASASMGFWVMMKL